MSDPTLDVVTRLHAALDAEANRLVPSTRTPPAMAWPPATTHLLRPRRAWLTPLAAAAAVVLVVVVAAVSRALMPAPVPAPATPVPSPPSSTNPTETPSSSSSVVTMGGARLILPLGWSASPVAASSAQPGAGWCLGPDGQCAVGFAAIDPRLAVNPESQGGYDADEATCGPGLGRRVLSASEDLLVQPGREAVYRVWTWTCPDGRTREVAQYVVPSPPGFILSTGQADPAVLEAMSAMMRTAQLPPAAPGALRYYDQGYVRSVTPSGDGYDLSIERAAGGYVNDWIATGARVVYHVPRALFTSGALPPANQVKGAVVVRTDGTVVTRILVPGG